MNDSHIQIPIPTGLITVIGIRDLFFHIGEGELPCEWMVFPYRGGGKMRKKKVRAKVLDDPESFVAKEFISKCSPMVKELDVNLLDVIKRETRWMVENYRKPNLLIMLGNLTFALIDSEKLNFYHGILNGERKGMLVNSEFRKIRTFKLASREHLDFLREDVTPLFQPE